ncbi:hypothetical protein ACTXG6_08460 [Pseudonocardia sp. Cha107L01]|uniref:hypothetical protein n=1 Tax=Pseudonocardia sp. Cha107L01 TaxID=3457576 RepID=UPI00403E380F
MHLDHFKLVDVVADGAIATPQLAHGKLIPLLILDTRSRPDVEDLIRVQRFLPPGDVTPSWATTADGPLAVILTLKFERPVETLFSVFLKAQKYGGIIDQIVTNGLLYLQAGAPGDRYSTTIEATRMAVEVDSSNFEDVWKEIFLETTSRTFIEKGWDASTAQKLAGEAIEGIRKLNAFRMPG